MRTNWSSIPRLATAALTAAAILLMSSTPAHADGVPKIAYSSFQGSSYPQIWLANPDGTEMTFHSNRDGNFRVYRINTNGTNLHPITEGTTAPGDWNGDWGLVNLPASVDGEDEDEALALQIPNPLRADAAIRFTTMAAGEARIEVFDSAGRRVRTLLHGGLSAGSHSASWDAKDDRGRACPAGLYHCRLTSGKSVRTARTVYLK